MKRVEVLLFYVSLNNHEYTFKGLLSRWEFIQVESAMQRKYGNANRSPASPASPASYSYPKRLQRHIMRCKLLQEFEQPKKAFHTSLPV